MAKPEAEQVHEGEQKKGHEGQAAQPFDGGKLLTEKQGQAGPGSKHFDSPTMADLKSVNNKDWDAYLVEQRAREDAMAKQMVARPDQDFNLDKFVQNRREQDEKALARLDDKDLKVVGDVAKALSGANGPDKALEVLKKAYGDNYDMKKMEGIDTALHLELQRRGMDKTWGVGISMGNEGALVQLEDKRINHATGGGQDYQKYQGKIAKFETD